MPFPIHRGRRLRRTEALRGLARETHLAPDQFVLPLFVIPGKGQRVPIASMPGVSQLSVDTAAVVAREAYSLGIRAVLLFGIPASKDAQGSEAWNSDGEVQRATRAIKDAVPDIAIITDLCFCEYTTHGHCGVLDQEGVNNDATLANLAHTAVSQARAGAGIIAPSGMMDGMVAAIRGGLDGEGFTHVPIMSYAAKYASAFYGPFRDAAQSAPAFGDRRGYQMDPANAREALAEIARDAEEGADIIMVKPALAYLDIVRAARERFWQPLAAYNVSAEYAMVKIAAAQGIIDGDRMMMEILTAIRRAGADIIITYHAAEAARLLG